MSTYVENPQSKPTVNLGGEEKNPLLILNRCRGAALKAGWTASQVDHFLDDATSRDHANMMDVVRRNFEVK